MSICIISGGFDPLHSGHIRLLNDASTHGDVYVLLNSDEWLTRKKGKPFMPWAERAEIIRNLWMRPRVIPVMDDDGTVCNGLEHIRITRPYEDIFFANGGDRTKKNTPELDVCRKLNITPLFNVGGGKIQSSSELIRNAMVNGC